MASAQTTMQIGVCSWSLAIPDLAQTLSTIKDTLGLGAVHLGLFDDGYKEPNKVIEIVQASGLRVSATAVAFAGEDYTTIADIARTGGYMPDDDFEQRLAKTAAVAAITAKLGTDLLSVHIGFVPEDSKHPRHALMVERVRRVADAVGEHGIRLIMETGQEPPEHLIVFMDAVGRPNLGVNFDPANMVMYGVGDPVEAVTLLKDRIVHAHMKDATWSAKPKQAWGEEVVLGTGDAEIPRIVSKLRAFGCTDTLAIEREGGNQRIADIKQGIELLKSLLG